MTVIVRVSWSSDAKILFGRGLGWLLCRGALHGEFLDVARPLTCTERWKWSSRIPPRQSNRDSLLERVIYGVDIFPVARGRGRRADVVGKASSGSVVKARRWSFAPLYLFETFLYLFDNVNLINVVASFFRIE